MRKPPEVHPRDVRRVPAESDTVLDKALVTIGRPRHGLTGTVEPQCDGVVTRVASRAREDHLPERT